MNYSYNFGSKFPNQVIDIGTRKDVDDSVIELIKQYYTYIDSGNIGSANELYNNNKNILEPYGFNASYLNRLEEEIYNLGVGLLSSMSTIISSNMPTNQSVNNYWLEDY